MIVRVTNEDIFKAGRSGGDNPVSRALLRATGQAWVVFGGSMAYSRNSPHHVLLLPYEVSQHWRAWTWEPFEFEVHSNHLGAKPRTDKRQRQRRAHPRFGHDRRARERRAQNRRRGDRRTSLAGIERGHDRRQSAAAVFQVAETETRMANVESEGAAG